jgi:hypothetical protein
VHLDNHNALTPGHLGIVKTPECSKNYEGILKVSIKCSFFCEISSSHGGEYDVQSCLLGCTAV